jgi:hypothetical protein
MPVSSSSGLLGNFQWVWQDLRSVGVAVLTMLVTYKLLDKSRRCHALQAEFVAAVGALRDRSETVTKQVMEHLMAESFTIKKQERSHWEILSKLKMCGTDMNRAALHLAQPNRDQLETEFLKWKSELTGAPFPVLKREYACTPHDGNVGRVNGAHEKWHDYLNGLAHSCIDGSLKIPLKPKQRQIA